MAATSTNFHHSTNQGVITAQGPKGNTHYSHKLAVAHEKFEVTADLGTPGSSYYIDRRVVDGRTPFLLAVSRARRPQRWHAARLNDKTRDPVAFILTPKVGRAKVVHAGSEVELRPGQYTVCTSEEPNISYYSANSEVFLGFIPDVNLVQDHRLTRHIGKERPIEGVGELFVRHVDCVLQIAHHLDSSSIAAASSAAGELLPAMLFPNSLSSPSATDALLSRIRSYIELKLHEPGLNAQQIAEAHYVSVRTVYRMFDKSDQSVAAYIRARRMQRCRMDVEERLDLSIAAICLRWGVTDLKHFSRQYRAYFGESPRETRQRLHRGLCHLAS